MADAVETDVNGGTAGPANPDLRWYIVHAYSGMEKAVERNIAERIARSDMQSKFGRILVPSEEVVEMRNGTRRTTERRLFPGYVFVEMVMDDDTWHLVKHTSKVTGFVGGAKIVLLPSPRKKFARSSTRCRKALRSLATRSSSWLAKWFVSRKVLSQTSMAPWKKSTTKRTVCVCRSPSLAVRLLWNWNSLKLRKLEIRNRI